MASLKVLIISALFSKIMNNYHNLIMTQCHGVFGPEGFVAKL